MKIKTQFLGTLLLFAVVLAAVSVSAVATNDEVQKASEQENVAYSVSQGANELSYLSNDYVMYRETQQLERWQARFETYSADVASLRPFNLDQESLVADIQTGSVRLKDVFDSISSGVSSRDEGVPLDMEFIQVSWSRMAVQSQGLSADASRLARLLDDRVTQVTQMRSTLVYVIVGLLGAFILAMYLLIYRGLLTSISTLQIGTSIIGSGNLDFKLKEDKNDEVGNLSRAFNRMTSSLKEVTASKQDLEKEIEERKRAETALKDSELRFRSLFTSMTEGVCEHDMVYDAEGRAVDYLISGTNPAYDAITGFHSAQAIGVRASEFYGSYPPPHLDMYSDVARTGVARSFETYYAPLNKHFSISVFSPTRGKFVTVFSDITQRERAQEELRETRDYLDNLFSYANAPIIVWDPEYRINRFNHAFERLTGRTSEEVLGQQLDVLFPARTRDTSMGRIRSVSVGQRMEVQEIPIQHTDGSERIVLWNSATVFGSDSKTPVATIAQGQDITERKQAEDDLRQRTIELEDANRELESFSYSVSHDLREPLRAIDGFSRILREDYGDKLDDEGKRILDVITRGTSRMGQLIADLLSFSRLSRQSMSFSRVDMTQLALAVAGEQRSLHPERDIEITVASLPETTGDPSLLQQVFVNLVSNAVKFTGNRTKATIEIGSNSAPLENVYYIKDNGVGFDPQYSNKLFAIFQRLHTQEQFEGTGVGLAIVQRIVARHGGRVRAEGKPGEGATLFFSLPKRGD